MVLIKPPVLFNVAESAAAGSKADALYTASDVFVAVPPVSGTGGNAFEVSRKKEAEKKIDGCSRERAQFSEPTTTTVRNLKKGKK